MLRKLKLEDYSGVRSTSNLTDEVEQPTAPLVVIVDDHEDSLTLATHVLEGMNCRCVPTKNSAECFSILEQIRPDIILLDILLPGIDGFEVLKKVRHHFKLLEIPIIAVTAQSSQADREKIIAEGFTDYLIKPFRLNTLVETMQYHLKQYHFNL